MHSEDAFSLTYVGHHSWAVSLRDTFVLVNPLLREDVGNSVGVRPSVWPSRRVDWAAMPQVSGVILTSPHVQSTQLSSLDELDRATPVFVSDRYPLVVAEAIRTLGFQVRVCSAGGEVPLGRLLVSFHSHDEAIEPWELGTSNVYIRSSSHSTGGVLVNSDVPVSAALIERFRTGCLPQPMATIVTNNLRLSARSVDNLLDPRPVGSLSHFEALSDMVLGAQDGYRPPPFLLLSGCGYRPADRRKYLFWDQRLLGRTLDRLALRQKVLGPLPGQRLDLTSSWFAPRIDSVDWIRVDRYEIPDQFDEESAGAPIAIVSPEDSDASALSRLLPAMQRLAVPLLHSQLGRALTGVDRHLGRHLGPERLVLQLAGAEGVLHHLALDINACRFVATASLEGSALKRWPVGMSTRLHDLLALVEGRLQAYELIRMSSRQWHPFGGFLKSPFGFLLAYYCDAIQPRHTESVLRHELERIAGRASATATLRKQQPWT